MSRSRLEGRMREQTFVDAGPGATAARRPSSVADPLRKVDEPALRDDRFREKQHHNVSVLTFYISVSHTPSSRRWTGSHPHPLRNPLMAHRRLCRSRRAPPAPLPCAPSVSSLDLATRAAFGDGPRLRACGEDLTVGREGQQQGGEDASKREGGLGKAAEHCGPAIRR